MSYSPSKCVDGSSLTDAANHEKIALRVCAADGTYVETVVRTVMTDEGKRYVTYKKKRYQVKKLKRAPRTISFVEHAGMETYVVRLVPVK